MGMQRALVSWNMFSNQAFYIRDLVLGRLTRDYQLKD